MELKKEIESILESLKKEGYERGQIESDLNYSENYIDQILSKGGNKRFLKALVDYKKRVLQIPISESNSEIPPSSIDFLKLKLEAKEEIIKAKDQVIEQIEARRKEAMAMAEKMERLYRDMKDAVELTKNTMNDILKSITANSDQNREQVLEKIQQLQEQTYIVSTQLEHQRTALGLGYPGQKQEQPVPFVKTGKGSALPRREDANKGKGG